MKRKIVAASFILGMIAAGFTMAPNFSHAEEAALSAETDYMGYKNRSAGGCKKATDFICETGRPVVIINNGNE